MEFKIREDKRSRHIIADVNVLPEAVEFIRLNNCNGLHLRSVLGEKEVIPDFRHFERIADQIIWLSFSLDQSVPKIDRFDSIYSLALLKNLIFNNPENFTIDLSRFPVLTYLGGSYWKGFKNLGGTQLLNTLVLSDYNKVDLSEIAGLSNLETLHLYTSSISTLKGIDQLANLSNLTLSRNKYLKEITGVNQITSLKIEKCPKILSDVFTSELTALRELSIDKIDSLNFLTKMPNLESLSFQELSNGQLHPILSRPNLKSIYFPHRTHFSHTLEQVKAANNASGV